jgi:hypothetical protein
MCFWDPGQGEIVSLERGTVAGLNDAIFADALDAYDIRIISPAAIHFGPHLYGENSAQVERGNGPIDDLAVRLCPDTGIDETQSFRQAVGNIQGFDRFIAVIADIYQK